jgi:hypothetical protein
MGRSIESVIGFGMTWRVNDVSIGSLADGAQAVKEEGLATWAPEACQIADLPGRLAHGDRIGFVKAKPANRMAYRVDPGREFRV